MAAAIGADVDQLRSLAKQFTQSADRLEQSSSGLSRVIGNAAFWRGNDANMFRTQWRSHSATSIGAAVKTLRTAADVLVRNADEQDQASAAGGGTATSSPSGTSESGKTLADPATNTNDLWNKINELKKNGSAGYQVQKIFGSDGKFRYVVYISGTDAADDQTLLSNAPALRGEIDRAVVEALKKIIDPPDAEVMLVGYSQGGMDAQNIAHDKLFNVTQVVTFGSPVRNDVDVPSLHLRASGDVIPAGNVGLGALDTAAGVERGKDIGGKLGSFLGDVGKKVGQATGSAIGGLIGGTQGVLDTGSPYVEHVTNPAYSEFTGDAGVNFNDYVNTDISSLKNTYDYQMAIHQCYGKIADQYDAFVAKNGVPEQALHMTDFQGTVVSDRSLGSASSGGKWS